MSQQIANLITDKKEQAAHELLLERLLPPKTDQLIDQREQAAFTVTLTRTASTPEEPDGRIKKSYTFKDADPNYRAIFDRERDLLLRTQPLETEEGDKKAYAGGLRDIKMQTQIKGYSTHMKNLGLDLCDWLFLLDPAKEDSPWRDVRFHLKLWLETLQTLQACHQINLLHCDLKADNICLEPQSVTPQQDSDSLHCTFKRSWVIDLALSLHPDIKCIPDIQIGGQGIPPRYTGAWKRTWPTSDNLLGLDWRIDLYRMGNMVREVRNTVLARGYNFALPPRNFPGNNYQALCTCLEQLPAKLQSFENQAWQEIQQGKGCTPKPVDHYTQLIKDIEKLIEGYTWPQVTLPRQRDSLPWRFYTSVAQETVGNAAETQLTDYPPTDKKQPIRPIGLSLLAVVLCGGLGLGLGFWIKDRESGKTQAVTETQAPTPADSNIPSAGTKEAPLSQKHFGKVPHPSEEQPGKEPPAKAPLTSTPGQPGTPLKACTDCPEVVWLPQGNYLRGSPTSEKERWSDEGPVRKVTIAYTLAAGKYPVTFKEWDACVSDGVCPKPKDEGWGRGKRPVINVSYDTITQKYLPWLNQKAKAAGQLPAGYQFMLPTESEREYFARGITSASDPHPPFPALPGTRWADGRCPHTDAFNYNGNYDYANCGAETGVNRGKTVAVDELPYPNRFGLFGVAGNVWEWTRDCKYDDYNQTPDDGGPAKETAGCNRLVRGGSWRLSNPAILRAAIRFNISPGNTGSDLGFRVVLSPRI